MVFTFAPFVEDLMEVEVEEADDLLFVCAEVEDTVVEVVMAGLCPGACWMSLPCSVIRAGASSCRFFRSCGSSFVRMRDLMGCFDDDSSLMVMSNYSKNIKVRRLKEIDDGTVRERTTYSSSSVSCATSGIVMVPSTSSPSSIEPT